jgi:hypothetical protein
MENFPTVLRLNGSPNFSELQKFSKGMWHQIRVPAYGFVKSLRQENFSQALAHMRKLLPEFPAIYTSLSGGTQCASESLLSVP